MVYVYACIWLQKKAKKPLSIQGHQIIKGRLFITSHFFPIFWQLPFPCHHFLYNKWKLVIVWNWHVENTLGHGLLKRWTDIFILPRTPWGLTFNPNNGTKIQSIIVKLSENIFLGMSKVRACLSNSMITPSELKLKFDSLVDRS